MNGTADRVDESDLHHSRLLLLGKGPSINYVARNIMVRGYGLSVASLLGPQCKARNIRVERGGGIRISNVTRNKIYGRPLILVLAL